MRYAIVNKDGIVINICEWDGITQWSPPTGCIAVQHDYCDINDFYDKFTGRLTKTIIITPDPS